jgi:uncharacterized protein YyaL (SSP411 family)
LQSVALRATAPGAAIAFGSPASHSLSAAGDSLSAGGQAVVPLLAHRTLVGGRAAAYVCRHFTCDAPVTDPAALAAALGARG